MTNYIDELFLDLEKSLSPNVTPNSLIYRRVDPDGIYNLFLAIDHEKNHLFILKINKNDYHRFNSLKSTKGLLFRVLKYNDDNDDQLTFEIKINEKKFNDLFTIFILDLIDTCFKETSENLMINSLITRILKWQKILEHQGLPLSIEKQIGLFGELIFLKVKLFPKYGINQSLVFWNGPEGATHDFKVSLNDFEVKTSTNTPNIVKISSEFQLQNNESNKLYLVHILLEESVNGKDLKSLITEIKDEIGDNEGNLIRFTKLLNFYGYYEKQSDKYLKKTFNMKMISNYIVDENFPKICPNNLPEGIENIKYQLDLNFCKDYLQNEEEILI